MLKKKVVFIVKYFYPIKRPSGITSFLYDLCNNIASDLDLSVISSKYTKQDKKIYHHLGYTIYKVGFPFPLQSALVAKKLKPDLVITFSGIYQPPMLPYFFPGKVFLTGLKNYFCQCTHFSGKMNQILTHYLNSYQKIIGLHPAITDKLKKITHQKVSTILPGIDFKRLDNVLPKKKENALRIGFFGHFTQRKGADILVETFLKLKDKNAELILAGDHGPLKEKFLKLAQTHANLKILDYQDDIFSWIKSCDFVVFPFRTSASILGIARGAQEAMYMGIPVIGSNVACLNTLVKDNVNGFIFDDENDLLKKMKILINNPDLRKKLSYQSHLEIKNNYSIEKTKEEFLKLIYS